MTRLQAILDAPRRPGDEAERMEAILTACMEEVEECIRTLRATWEDAEADVNDWIDPDKEGDDPAWEDDAEYEWLPTEDADDE